MKINKTTKPFLIKQKLHTINIYVCLETHFAFYFFKLFFEYNKEIVNKYRGMFFGIKKNHQSFCGNRTLVSDPC